MELAFGIFIGILLCAVIALYVIFSERTTELAHLVGDSAKTTGVLAGRIEVLEKRRSVMAEAVLAHPANKTYIAGQKPRTWNEDAAEAVTR